MAKGFSQEGPGGGEATAGAHGTAPQQGGAGGGGVASFTHIAGPTLMKGVQWVLFEFL